MKTQTQTTGETINISREKLVSIVSQLSGGTSGKPDLDESDPKPWGDIADKIAYRLGEPRPIPWRSAGFASLQKQRLEFFALLFPEIWDLIGDRVRFNSVELNPQPIPPRDAFLDAFTREAIDRVLLTQEIADAMNETGEQQGKIIVGGRLSQLVDYLCGTAIKLKFPIPRPKHDTDDKLSGIELLTAGAIFEQTAKNIHREDLRQEFRNAGAKLIETGISRM
ncbi:MAG: hypothetical protein M3388_00450 [Acidobacteriota bacterium]|nr:hypothetical protein [Acidobacteriota bacterium]